MIKRPGNAGVQSQLGWDTVMRGPAKPSTAEQPAGGNGEGKRGRGGPQGQGGGGTQPRVHTAGGVSAELAHDKGGVGLLTPPPGKGRGLPGAAARSPTERTGSKEEDTRAQLRSSTTWDRAQRHWLAEQQQDKDQVALLEQQVRAGT